MKTVNKLLKKATDPYLTLLNYYATPLQRCGKSPTELLMGRKVKTTLPVTQHQLVLQWDYLPEFRQKEEVFKNQQKTLRSMSQGQVIVSTPTRCYYCGEDRCSNCERFSTVPLFSSKVIPCGDSIRTTEEEQTTLNTSSRDLTSTPLKFNRFISST